jgi:hypothetical protein
MIRRLALISAAAVLFSGVAFAGNIPEFDTVCDDSANRFNYEPKEMVIENNINGNGVLINTDSDFCPVFDTDPVTGAMTFWEYFRSTAAAPRPDACFDYTDAAGNVRTYLSRKTGPWFPTYYEWKIVLQMAPEADLNLNIRDCVLKENQTDLWFYAQQTGRWRLPNGQLMFLAGANPSMTATVSPGINQPAGALPFIMDARTLPGLGLVSMSQQPYTTKAHWEEGIVLALPEAGGFNQAGAPTFVLREGDMVTVRVDVPFFNAVDIWYGPDNVSLKYIGVLGMDLVAADLP